MKPDNTNKEKLFEIEVEFDFVKKCNELIAKYYEQIKEHKMKSDK